MPRRKKFQFIEDEAEEADSDNSEISQEIQDNNTYQEENQRIREINQRRLESQRRFEERFRLFQEQEEYEDKEFSPYSDDVDSIDILDNLDTNMFRIQVQKNHEVGIMLMMLNFSEEHPNIISVIYNPKTKGILYVETKQEHYLKNLIRALNLHFTNPEVVDKEYFYDLINSYDSVNIRPGQWVRVKKHKLYAKDLAKVLSVNQLKQKCKLKLLQRIKNIHGSEKLPISFIVRRNLEDQGVDDHLQQLFNQQEVQLEQDNQQEEVQQLPQTTQVQSQFIYHDIEAEGQLAKVDGFHVLIVSTKNVITDIQINEDELRLFFPDVTDRRELVRQAQRELMRSIDFDFKIGDKVRIIAQEESPEFVVMNKDENNMLELESVIQQDNINDKEKYVIHASQVKMSFSLYQEVKIIDGPYKGNCGIIIEMGKNYCLIDCGDQQVFKVPFSVVCVGRNVYTKNFALVRYGQSQQDVGCVITQKEKSLTLLTLDNKRLDCLKVNIQKFEHRYWFEYNDQGQQIKCQDNVIVRFGKYKDKKALVLHLLNKKSFLYSREFPDSVILEDISNLYLLTSGADHMLQAINKREYKKYLGRYIKIKNGQWMGYQGQIVSTMNDKFKVQLSTKSITMFVPIKQYIDQL